MARFKVFSVAGMVSLLSVVDSRLSNFGRPSFCTPEESEERQERKYRRWGFSKEKHDDPEQQESANLGTRFARVTNSVLKLNPDSIETEVIDKIYLQYMQDAKAVLLGNINFQLKKLEYYKKNPSSRMPAWLAKSPPTTRFFTDGIDMRLESRVSQIEQDLKSFVEELGFVCTHVGFIGSTYSGGFFYVELQLNVSHVPTKKTRENADANLDSDGTGGDPVLDSMSVVISFLCSKYKKDLPGIWDLRSSLVSVQFQQLVKGYPWLPRWLLKFEHCKVALFFIVTRMCLVFIRRIYTLDRN